MKQSPICFDVYTVTPKEVGYIFQVFVAYSENGT